MERKLVEALGVIIGILVICIGLTACGTNKQKGAEEDVIIYEEEKQYGVIGAFLTYGTEDSNETQDKIKAAKQITAKVEGDKLVFDGIEGPYVTSCIVDEEGMLDTGNWYENSTMCGSDSGAGSLYIRSDFDKDVTVYVNPIYKDEENRIYVTDDGAVKKTVLADAIKKAETASEGLKLLEQVELVDEDGDNKQITVYIQAYKATISNVFKIQSLDEGGNIIDAIEYNQDDIKSNNAKSIKKGKTYKFIYPTGEEEVYEAEEFVDENNVVYGMYARFAYDEIIMEELVTLDTTVN